MKTIKLNRNKIYLIGLTTILIFIVLNRVNFIIGSKFATGKVIKIKSWSERGSRGGASYYTAPIIKFTDQNYDIIFQGEANMDVAPGQFVKVIYKSDDQTNAEVFNFVGFLLPSLLYSLIPLLLLSAATYSFIEQTEIVIINLDSIFRIRINKEKESSK